jgi:hypothetical protein
MGNCFVKSNKFLKEQMNDEYYNKKVNMNIIGNYKPYQVFIGDEIKITKTILGLNSLCDCNIHISIGNKPTRIILSYVENIDFSNYKKGQTFHIYKIDYKELSNIEEITQYDIYNAIQDYIFVNKQNPKNENIITAI